jgi:hypothetical protein
MSILKEIDVGWPVNELWRSDGSRSATYEKWNVTYGGLESSDYHAAEGIGTRKRPPHTDVCGPLLGACRAQGWPRKKALRPVERRDAVAHLVSPDGLPVQRACRAQSDHIRPTGGQLDPARESGHCSADHAGYHEPLLGVLEIRGSAAEHRASLEPYAPMAGVRPTPAHFATTDQEAAAGTACAPDGRAPTA